VARDALLDQELPDLSRDLAPLRTGDGVAQVLVGDPLLTRAPRKLLQLEELHSYAPMPAGDGSSLWQSLPASEHLNVPTEI
jgi:hypothetical protein